MFPNTSAPVPEVVKSIVHVTPGLADTYDVGVNATPVTATAPADAANHAANANAPHRAAAIALPAPQRVTIPINRPNWRLPAACRKTEPSQRYNSLSQNVSPAKHTKKKPRMAEPNLAAIRGSVRPIRDSNPCRRRERAVS